MHGEVTGRKLVFAIVVVFNDPLVYIFVPPGKLELLFERGSRDFPLLS
jgi:hypothetical protein